MNGLHPVTKFTIQLSPAIQINGITGSQQLRPTIDPAKSNIWTSWTRERFKVLAYSVAR
jgi:hypothetical protein